MNRAHPSRAGDGPLLMRSTWRLGALCLAVLVSAGCKRTDEAALRTLLAEWVPLGDTVSFRAARGCAAGVFELVGTHMSSRLRVAQDAREAAMILKSRDQVAIDARRTSPDAALLALIEAERGIGMRMRIVGLEARECMDTDAEGHFAAALVDPRAVLLIDGAAGVLALMDPQDRVLIAVMGAE